MIQSLKQIAQTFDRKYPLYSKIARFIVAGSIATLFDLYMLYFFKEWIHIGYLLSAVLAFICAFFVSFFLQKYWTFKETHTTQVHRQMVIYLSVSLANLGINTLLMYTLVDYCAFHYLTAQLVACGIVACISFFTSQKLVFKAEIVG